MLYTESSPVQAVSAMTSVTSKLPLNSVPLTQNTAPIHEFACLYTHDIQRKRQKRWQDGLLRYHTFNRRVLVYDVARSYIGETFLKSREYLEDGDEIRLDRGVLVQVCEQKGTVEQDRTQILEKIGPRQQQHTPLRAAKSTISPTSVPIYNVPPQLGALSPKATSGLERLRPKPLNAILGIPRGAYGRAAIPSISPYREKHGYGDETQHASKRQRVSTLEELADKPSRIREKTADERRSSVVVRKLSIDSISKPSTSKTELGAPQRRQHERRSRITIDLSAHEEAVQDNNMIQEERIQIPAHHPEKENIPKRYSRLRSATKKPKSLVYQNIMDKRMERHTESGARKENDRGNHIESVAAEQNSNLPTERVSPNGGHKHLVELQPEFLRGSGSPTPLNRNSSDEDDAFESWDIIVGSKSRRAMVANSDGPSQTRHQLHKNRSFRPTVPSVEIESLRLRKPCDPSPGDLRVAKDHSRSSQEKASESDQALVEDEFPSFGLSQMIPSTRDMLCALDERSLSKSNRGIKVSCLRTAPRNSPLHLRCRASPLKKSLSDPAPGSAKPPNPLTNLKRSTTDVISAANHESSAVDYNGGDDKGPWSRETFVLFGFLGGETWSVNGGIANAVVGKDDPPELVERKRELIRQGKKKCQGMAGDAKTSMRTLSDEYDYIESTYS